MKKELSKLKMDFKQKKREYIYKTSTKEGVNIEEMFETATKDMKYKKDEGLLIYGFVRC